MMKKFIWLLCICGLLMISSCGRLSFSGPYPVGQGKAKMMISKNQADSIQVSPGDEELMRLNSSEKGK